MRSVFFANTQYILDALERLEGVYDTRLLDFLKLQRIRKVQMLHEQDFFARVIELYSGSNSDELLQGYYLERKFIFHYEKGGLINKRQARALRQNVNMLESYTLKEQQANISTTILEYLNRDTQK
ncbi:MAG: hypothetical protein LBV67_07330 [Streptococcaceae bacterium]|nr:hypothetical protein [Streptococcaceae bacterium]